MSMDANIDQLAEGFKDIANSVGASDIKKQARSYALAISDNKISEDDLLLSFKGLKQEDLKKILMEPVSGDVRQSYASKGSTFGLLIQSKQEKVVTYILDNKLIDDINAIDADYFNPLMLAIVYGEFALVKRLLQYGADPCIYYKPKLSIDHKSGIEYDKLPLDELYDIPKLKQPVDSDIQNQIIETIKKEKKQKHC